MTTWSILCDFDGTISVDDVTDVLLERFGKPGWQMLEEEWRQGRLSSRRCMQAQIGMLSASKDELDAAIDAIRIDPVFPQFVREVRKLGWPLAIVSDGLDYAIERILARHGLKGIPIYANRFTRQGGETWCLDSPHAAKNCRVDSGTCKCAIVRREQAAGRRVLLVGDGASDFCAAANVDFVFAKYRLNEYCRVHELHHFSIVGFSDAVELLPALVGDTDRIDSGAPQPELMRDARI